MGAMNGPDSSLRRKRRLQMTKSQSGKESSCFGF